MQKVLAAEFYLSFNILFAKGQPVKEEDKGTRGKPCR